MRKAIFIVGISPRSGTNFLYNLLLLHPDIICSSIEGEDFFIFHSPQLVRYADQVEHYRSSDWRNNKVQLLQSLGKGLVVALQNKEANAEKYVLTRTPLMNNIDNFPLLINENDAKLVLLCRRGQDICESYQRSYQPSFERALDKVEEGARLMNDFLDRHQERYLLVKYEELIHNLEEEMSNLLHYLDLSKDRFPFQKARTLKIFGSSTTTSSKGQFVWKVTRRADNFKPTSRSSTWNKWKHYRFNYRAGKEFHKLQYDTLYNNKGIEYYLYNWFCDFKQIPYNIIHKKVKPLIKRLLNRY